MFVVNDLLRLTEAESANFVVHEDNLDLRAMVSEVIAVFRDEEKSKKLHIQFIDDPEIPAHVRCDPSGLRQVLSNLMANAMKYSNREGGLVQLSLKLLNTTDTKILIEISFQDQGSGLSERNLDKIFQDFEQILDEDDAQISEISEPPRIIPKSPATHASIGLGLATTARFVRLNHGQISIASEEGLGTRVSINIPFRKGLRFHRDKRPSTEISLPTPPEVPFPHTGNRTGTSPSNSGASSYKELRDNQYSSSSKRRKDTSLGSPIATYAESSTSPQVDVSGLSPKSPLSSTDHFPFPRTGLQEAQHKFRILVAEDNPLNSRLIQTRLVRSGHDVKVTVDGQICAEAFKNSPSDFDAVLMDIQVSTKSPSLR